MTETRRTYCGLCHPRCGLLMDIENGRAVAVRGDKDHPITKGMICSRWPPTALLGRVEKENQARTVSLSHK